MNPVWIPPSPPNRCTESPKLEPRLIMQQQSKDHNPSQSQYHQQEQHLAVIQSIVDKIHLGREEISHQDLKALEEAIVAVEEDHPLTPGVIPNVDRAFVRSCASDPKVLVRFVGMVQDMLDPEYYVTRIQGVWTKYREYYNDSDSCHQSIGGDSGGDDHQEGQCVHISNEEDEMTLRNKDWWLEERQPLVLVPIPNSTSVLREYMASIGGSGASVGGCDSMNDDNDKSGMVKKRTCEELKGDGTFSMEEREREEDSCYNRRYKQHESSSEGTEYEHSLELSKTNRDCDWWPRGCLNSDDAQCPVLAKMYYSADATANAMNQKRLQLNDIVQVYGILSIDPRGATFDSSMTFMSEQYGGIFNMGLGLDVMDSDTTMCLPPPSLLPRFHVLKYNVLDLDVYMAQKEREKMKQEQDMVQSSLLMERTNMNCSIQNDRQFAIDFFAMHIFGGNQTAAEALLMVLMSMAERNHRLDNRTMRLPSGETLGCGSINYVLSDSESCAILHDKLNAILGMILPVVANVGVSLSSLNSVEDDSLPTAYGMMAPTKNAVNRLEPSILQLPRASCVIVNQAYMSEGALSPSGQRALTALAKISSTHTVPYRFEGEMEIDFEADVRIIVLSVNNTSFNVAGGSKLMPCSLVMRLESQNMEMIDGAEAMSRVHEESFCRIRRYIAKCRSNESFSYNSISLDKLLLGRAQKDFIEARQKSKTLGGREVTEHDFHRWLLLTRLQARSQIGAGMRKCREKSFAAEIEDWENALILDEGMR